ncbi:hypothetical protein H7J87_12350 [Mycolicibacterium wolinskyi]|uniref:Uncharacterized protein n=1 Tax=Mycolicibacterium wolinskyi TaxID=59750 RepID=A0A1X2FJH0_9MYCO|nr:MULTISPECIES: hypothetical protein [Mycolicibacterium]MCV7286119.1 hypothetical protein [Mycolicibacterium wolinskyi]MCV7296315.1 hypothetical protein [Mycolicibacterium goodii]ORX18537.1 hypothetical protein AWC31_14670 [Mycolicibacterium wolinskyi]
MTFVIAKLTDPDAGKLTLVSDTKFTDRNNNTLNRQTLSNPGQKVVIVDDDVVVGFAGDTPAPAVNRVAELRGRSADEIEDALLALSEEMNRTAGLSKSFLVVVRKPNPRIIVIRRGEREDRTAIRTGWIGDPQAFKAFSEVFQDSSAPADLDVERRFVIAMIDLVSSGEVDTVGGYLIRVSGSSDKPFRFASDAAFIMPDDINGTIVQTPEGQTSLEWSLAEGADPTNHLQLSIPGTGQTFGALAQYIPEAGTARLHTHERPGDPAIALAVRSLDELVDTASSKYGQYLDPTVAQRRLQGDRPPPSVMYIRPHR